MTVAIFLLLVKRANFAQSAIVRTAVITRIRLYVFARWQMSPLDKALSLALRAHLEAFDAARHMAGRVRAISYRVPFTVRVGNRGFTYSISGWRGAA